MWRRSPGRRAKHAAGCCLRRTTEHAAALSAPQPVLPAAHSRCSSTRATCWRGTSATRSCSTVPTGRLGPDVGSCHCCKATTTAPVGDAAGGAGAGVVVRESVCMCMGGWGGVGGWKGAVAAGSGVRTIVLQLLRRFQSLLRLSQQGRSCPCCEQWSAAQACILPTTSQPTGLGSALCSYLLPAGQVQPQRCQGSRLRLALTGPKTSLEAFGAELDIQDTDFVHVDQVGGPCGGRWRRRWCWE